MKLISEFRRVYRHYGQGVKPWLITFGILATVAIIGYGIVIARVIAEGSLPASPPDWTLLSAWLASGFAFVVFMEIDSLIKDNYRNEIHELRVNREILLGIRARVKGSKNE